MKLQKRVLLASMVALLLLSLGCVTTSVNRVNVGALETKTETIELADASAVRVDIRMGAGELTLEGGAEALLEADFVYNVSSWEPEVEYQVTAGEGRLTVRQPNTDQMSMGREMRYEWDLALNASVPLDVRINMGAGQSKLDLGDLRITRLDLKLGAGDAEVDLRGNETLQRLDVDMGAGQLVLDLRGDWQENVTVTLQGGVGRSELRLPDTIGVKVTVTQGLGEIVANGLTRQSNGYVNALYGVSDVTMEVTIRAGIGSVLLESD